MSIYQQFKKKMSASECKVNVILYKYYYLNNVNN